MPWNVGGALLARVDPPALAARDAADDLPNMVEQSLGFAEPFPTLDDLPALADDPSWLSYDILARPDCCGVANAVLEGHGGISAGGLPVGPFEGAETRFGVRHGLIEESRVSDGGAGRYVYRRPMSVR